MCDDAGMLGSHGPLSRMDQRAFQIAISCAPFVDVCWSPPRSFGASPLRPTTDASQPIAPENERSEPSGFASFLAPWTTHNDFGLGPDLTEVLKSAGHITSVRSSSGKHFCGLRYLELFLWLEDASCPHCTLWRFSFMILPGEALSFLWLPG